MQAEKEKETKNQEQIVNKLISSGMFMTTEGVNMAHVQAGGPAGAAMAVLLQTWKLKFEPRPFVKWTSTAFNFCYFGFLGLLMTGDISYLISPALCFTAV